MLTFRDPISNTGFCLEINNPDETTVSQVKQMLLNKFSQDSQYEHLIEKFQNIGNVRLIQGTELINGRMIGTYNCCSNTIILMHKLTQSDVDRQQQEYSAKLSNLVASLCKLPEKNMLNLLNNLSKDTISDIDKHITPVQQSQTSPRYTHK